MSEKKVLITDDCHPYLIAALTNMGYTCDFLPDITPEKTLEIIPQYEGLIINSKIDVNRSFLDRAVCLKFVGRLGSGMEVVDRPYAAEKGVFVMSSPEGNRNAVGEQALGMLLSLANNLCRADREVRQMIWEREARRGWELMGKTIGIVGFGHTGRSFATKLAGFGMEVLVYDKYQNHGYAHHFPWVKEVQDLEVIQKYSQIISLHLPLNSETRHLVNQNFIEKCQDAFVLINTSRGKIVDTLSVVEALENGKMRGACLDVFENEKPKTFTEEEITLYKRLYQLDNVVLAPHIAGWTHESKRRMAEMLIEKLTKSKSNNH